MLGGILADLSRDYHLLAPELLGWGRTDKVVYFDRSPYVARIPHIAASFLRQVGVESADYLGASFGGSLIMRAAVARAIPGRSVGVWCGIGGPYRLVGDRRIGRLYAEPGSGGQTHRSRGPPPVLRITSRSATKQFDPRSLGGPHGSPPEESVR